MSIQKKILVRWEAAKAFGLLCVWVAQMQSEQIVKVNQPTKMHHEWPRREWPWSSIELGRITDDANTRATERDDNTASNSHQKGPFSKGEHGGESAKHSRFVL